MDEQAGSNVVSVGVDLSEFYMSVEWDILEVPAVRLVRFDISLSDFSYNHSYFLLNLCVERFCTTPMATAPYYQLFYLKVIMYKHYIYVLV